MNKLTTAALLSGLVVSGAAIAQDDPHQAHVNSDTAYPNSPWKNNGIPDAGTFNPTGRYVPPVVIVQAPPPPPPPVVRPPAPVPPPPAVAPAPAPAPMPAPAPEPRAPRPDRG